MMPEVMPNDTTKRPATALTCVGKDQQQMMLFSIINIEITNRQIMNRTIDKVLLSFTTCRSIKAVIQIATPRLKDSKVFLSNRWATNSIRTIDTIKESPERKMLSEMTSLVAEESSMAGVEKRYRPEKVVPQMGIITNNMDLYLKRSIIEYDYSKYSLCRSDTYSRLRFKSYTPFIFFILTRVLRIFSGAQLLSSSIGVFCRTKMTASRMKKEGMMQKMRKGVFQSLKGSNMREFMIKPILASTLMMFMYRIRFTYITISVGRQLPI